MELDAVHQILTIYLLDQGGHKHENLKYSGISLNMENSGNSQGILCNLREKL